MSSEVSPLELSSTGTATMQQESSNHEATQAAAHSAPKPKAVQATTRPGAPRLISVMHV